MRIHQPAKLRGLLFIQHPVGPNQVNYLVIIAGQKAVFQLVEVGYWL